MSNDHRLARAPHHPHLPLAAHPDEVRLLWHTSYYDGPLEGMARYDGRHHWFALGPGSQEADARREFVLYPLTDAEITAEIEDHRLFRELVGAHCDYRYDAHGRRHRAMARDLVSSSWESYGRRVADRPPRRYRAREPVAAFLLDPSPHCRRPRSLRWWARRVGAPGA